jgi:hypothetical protein
MNTNTILEKIYEIEGILLSIKKELDSNTDSKTYTKGLDFNSNSLSKPKLYPKSVKLIERLLDLNTNQKTEAFLSSLVNNNYTTITLGQKKVIDELCIQLNLNPDDYKDMQ